MLTEQENDALDRFVRTYCQDEVARVAQGYPRDTQSFYIDFMDLYQASQKFADRLTEDPETCYRFLTDVVQNHSWPVDQEFNDLQVRVRGGSYERTVNELRQNDVGKYITVRGQINEMTQVQPKPKYAAFNCSECANTLEVEQRGTNLRTPAKDCETCDGYSEWILDDTATTYKDHQVIDLAALPEDTGGGVAESIKVEVTGDETGKVEAGDRVAVSGILKTDSRDVMHETKPNARRPIYLEGYAIQPEQESFGEIEPRRIDEIQELSNEPDIYQKLINSFAPHIVTEDDGDMQKLSIILSLFGGVQKQLDTGSQIRGNINVLLIGDGGTAKSQFLKTAEKIAPKSVMASGKGATAAGLTATAEQSNLTGEWTLKAGALVLANDGVACIDEFDKMTDSARKSIHEALENQEIPVTKAGINTTLPAKTAVIAAANPEGGEFDRFDTLSSQTDMQQPLVSRFDLIFGLVDEQDENRDATIARAQHDIADGERAEPEIEYELLREYIAYARKIEPEYTSEEVKQRLVDYYVSLRKEAEDGDEPGPRLNDSLRRLAQASARVRLSDTITMDDAQRAIEHLKYTIGQIGLDEAGNVSGSQLSGGKPVKSQGDRRDKITNVLADDSMTIEEIADQTGISQSVVESDIGKLKQKGRIYEPQRGEYLKI